MDEMHSHVREFAESRCMRRRAPVGDVHIPPPVEMTKSSVPAPKTHIAETTISMLCTAIPETLFQ